VKVKVTGAAAKIDALFRFDKEVWRGIQSDVKRAAELVAMEARGNVPTRPLSNWGAWESSGLYRDVRSGSPGKDLSFNGAKEATGIKSRFKSRRLQSVRVVKGRAEITSAALAILSTAGAKYQDTAFNTNLIGQYGRGSKGSQYWPRVLTPAYYAKGGEARKAIAETIERAVAKVNQAG
jgi:hypothetical protein